VMAEQREFFPLWWVPRAVDICYLTVWSLVNLWWVPKAVDICDGRAMGVLPRPIIPLAPLARPFSKNVGAQEKTN
jgi:hypothetical protein